jgi:predicted Holliday junction resolvase-like endonuclease
MALTPAERVRRWRAKKKQLQQQPVKEQIKEQIKEEIVKEETKAEIKTEIRTEMKTEIRTETVREIVKGEGKDKIEGQITEIIYMLPPKQISKLRLLSYLPTPINWTDYNSSNYLITF